MKIDKSALLQEGSGGGCRQRGAGASSTSYTSIMQPGRVLLGTEIKICRELRTTT